MPCARRRARQDAGEAPEVGRRVPAAPTSGQTTRPLPHTSRSTPTAIAAEGDKPFQAIGGIVELLGDDYFPVTR